jgi:hypothetical protein
MIAKGPRKQDLCTDSSGFIGHCNCRIEQYNMSATAPTGFYQSQQSNSALFLDDRFEGFNGESYGTASDRRKHELANFCPNYFRIRSNCQV